MPSGTLTPTPTAVAFPLLPEWVQFDGEAVADEAGVIARLLRALSVGLVPWAAVWVVSARAWDKAADCHAASAVRPVMFSCWIPYI